MKRVSWWLRVVAPLLIFSVACGKSPPPAAVLAQTSGDPHATEQLAMEHAAIELLGTRLGPRFPVDPADDRNELPNAVVVVDHGAQSSPQPEETGADPAPGLGPRRATMRT